jgi:hypothetical protein
MHLSYPDHVGSLTFSKALRMKKSSVDVVSVADGNVAVVDSLAVS